MGKKAVHLVTAQGLQFIDAELDHLTMVIAGLSRGRDPVLSLDYWRERILEVVVESRSPMQRQLTRAAYLIAEVDAVESKQLSRRRHR